MAFECVLMAWHSHQAELQGFLIGQIKEPAMSAATSSLMVLAVSRPSDGGLYSEDESG